MITLNRDQQGTLNGFLSRLQDNVATPLDTANDAGALGMVQLFLSLSNKGADRYPALNAALTSPNGAPSNNGDAPVIVDLGQDAQGRSTSRTWMGSSGRPYMSGAATLVIDADSHQPLAFGTATQVGEGLVQVSTETASAEKAVPRQTAITVYHAQRSADAQPHFGVIARTATTLTAGPTVNVTAPIITISGHTSIKIGLNRKGAQPDCDYSFLESAPQSDPPLLVPFAGSADIHTPILGIGGDGHIAGLSVTSAIFVRLSATSPSGPTTPSQLTNGITANPSAPTVVHWSFPYSPVQPIVYNAATNALDVLSAFYFLFNVPVNAPNSPYSFAVCSTDTPNQPSVACKLIPDIMFTWHCLAEDTMVQLHDGRSVPIKDLDNRLRLQTGIGSGSLAAEATWRGTHSPAGGPAIRLQTAAGQNLVATAGHAILTPTGLVAAGDLTVGTHVMVAGGTSSPLTATDRIAYTGGVWNVLLGNDDDRRGGYLVDSMPGTFLANGIVVGDLHAQGRMYRASRRSLEYMTQRIPASQHRDYASALEDCARV